MEDNTLRKFDRIALYAVIYTAISIVFYITMPYILPFVLGTIIALISQPVIKFFTKKLRVKRPLAALIIVLIIFALFFTILTVIIIKIINELVSLSYMLPGLITTIKNEGFKFLDKATMYFNTLDPSIINSIKGAADKLFSGSLTGSLTVAVYIVNFALNILKSLPNAIMLILFTILTAVYVAIDFPKLKEKFFSLFTKEGSSKARSIVFEANKMIGSYIKAYAILISITFIETYIGFNILGIKYAASLSLVTSVSDLLPVLGPGTVLIPMGIGFIITGNYVKGIGLLVLYLIVTAVRQVLEPKVVSSSLGIYPLSIIVAIYIGLKLYGIAGMFFAVFFVVFYSILQRVKVL